MDDYNPSQLIKDAVNFSKSRFGKHYLANLDLIIDTHISDAKKKGISTQERGEYMLLAAQVEEIKTYFKTAQTVAKNPNLLQKMIDGYKNRTNQVQK